MQSSNKIPLGQIENIDKNTVGLGNVDNTSDVNKPISNATQSALNNKEDTINKATDFSIINDTLYPTVKAVNDQISGLSTLQLGETSSTAYRGDRGKTAYEHSQLTSGNPHNVNKSDVGLGNVNNTSDADKPISTATQSALDDKADKDGGNATGNLATTMANSHTHTNKSILDATTASYTTAEKSKLAGIEAGAQVNVKADWNATSGDAEILNKPNTFTPSAHTHPISDITGLQAELNTKLESTDLDGFIYNVQYNSSIHTITFYQQNEPNLVVDLPIEQLIKGVQLVGNDLVFTFEDDSTVTVPLNTLLVGVVKSVNGLSPNSQGEITLNVADIPNLSNALNNKQDTLVSGVNIKTVDGQSLLGTGDIPIPPGLSLGETSTTAYRGDRGKIAYDHSLLTSGNPHNVTKSDVGLGNVDNTSDIDKPISTPAQNEFNNKQDNLVSGTNIKTVGGQSLLGTGNIQFPGGLALGELSFTAYRGDRGKVAYDHSLITTGNPHNVTKADVGLSAVNNVQTNDGTLLLTSNSVTLGLFSANQSAHNTIDIPVPSKISEIIIDTEDYTFDFTDSLEINFRADYNFLSLDSITNVWNTPTITITTAGSTPYTLGTPVPMGTLFTLTASVPSVVRIKTTR